jgi:hypothetical protein
MLGRRDIVLGGLLTILWGGCGCPAHAGLSPRAARACGCMLDPEEATSYLNASLVMPQQVTRDKPVIASSGDKGFDFALAQTLYRISETFGVMPGFAFYDDYDGPNAFAMRASKLGNPDGTVLFGLRYLKAALAQKEYPDIWVTSICAHEFGHILQYKRGLDLISGQKTIKRCELHADFLSGFYAGRLKLQRPDYPAAVFATQEYAAGNYDYANPSFHGTPDERAHAVVRGFEAAYRDRLKLDEAFDLGVKFVEV